jgi:hypothetical protein
MPTAATRSVPRSMTPDSLFDLSFKRKTTTATPSPADSFARYAHSVIPRAFSGLRPDSSRATASAVRGISCGFLGLRSLAGECGADAGQFGGDGAALQEDEAREDDDEPDDGGTVDDLAQQ